jgi:hypothetical protein
MLKAIVHEIAANLTNAVMKVMPLSAIPAASPGAPTAMEIQTFVCQVHTNYFEWVRASESSSAWPTPVLDPTWLAGAIAMSFGPPPSGTIPASGPAPAPSGIPVNIAPAPVSRAMNTDPTFAKMLLILPGNPNGK